jgi:DNA-binding transcriptional regulator YhcF (GntR family)
MSHSSKQRRAVIWQQEDGTAVSCEEKLKVLNENLEEIRQFCQDAFEDALLMDCDEEQIRQVFSSVIDSLKNPYRKG